MKKIKRLSVATPQGPSGFLDKESRYAFNYQLAEGERTREVSLTMPIRAESYTYTDLLPVFAMNKPEGFLYDEIVRRVAKHEHIDDMRLLSILGANQIGRLSFFIPETPLKSLKPQIGRAELLKHPASSELFEFLVDTYFESGISGVQPKVLMVDADQSLPSKTTTLYHDLIVKAAGDDYPFLTQNEFLCMSAARLAGIEVPHFWLSDDGGLFVMERFDLKNGMRLGFEDMAVLLGKHPDKQGNYKYQESYEAICRAIQSFCKNGAAVESRQQFFSYLALSIMVRNGDAHLKNFGLLYENPHTDSPRLAPIYDVVTTTVYEYVSARTGRTMVDRTLALKLNKSKSYPMRDDLLQFGEKFCGVIHPAAVIEQIADAMSETLRIYRDRVDPTFFAKLIKEWDGGRIWMEPNQVYFSTPPQSNSNSDNPH